MFRLHGELWRATGDGGSNQGSPVLQKLVHSSVDKI
jgi:hypothetical protein